jgi:hypothetical protein
MDLDIEKIILDKVSLMKNSGQLRKIIEDKTESTIKEAVSSCFDWDLAREIKNKIKNEVSAIFEKIDFAGYIRLINQCTTQCMHDLKMTSASEIKKMFEKVFLKRTDDVKMSEIIEDVLEYFRDDYEEYSEDNVFFRHSDDSYFIKVGDSECRISLFSDKTIYKVRVDGVDIGLDSLGDVFTSCFKSKLLNLILNRNEIIIDVDSDQIQCMLDEFIAGDEDGC